jgi:tetratricopeptide (TPR) repeat protein
MKPRSDTPDLLAALLREVDGASGTSAAGHPDVETLAQLAEGALSNPAERTQIIEHVADCPECRQTVSWLLKAEAVEKETRQNERRGWWAMPRLTLAVAATILIGAGLIFAVSQQKAGLSEQQAYQQGTQLLAAGEFSKAHELLAGAARNGVSSNRLRNLDAAALLRVPGPLALAHRGRLSDFGLEIGGIAARSPSAGAEGANLKAAHDLLANSEDDPAVLLNRGYVLLALGQPQQALNDFEAALGQSPEVALAWLGKGLALFLSGDYPAAESAFQRCTQLNPEDISGWINLAMALEEQNKSQEAIATWKQLLAGTLEDDDRRRIEQAVKQLEQEAPR